MYADLDEYVEGTAAFLKEGIEKGEAALVVISAEKIALLRAALGDAPGVQFADMANVGMNPARILPAWREFVAERVAAGGGFRGIGEPIWAERTPNQLIECQRHEALLNLAFDDGPAWWLLCPYHTTALGQDVLDEACRSHPQVLEGAAHTLSATYRQPASVFDVPLPEPGGEITELRFAFGPLREVREVAAWCAGRAGLSVDDTAALVLAVDEVASNSLRHGGGEGVLRVWQERGEVVCEVHDAGLIDDPLVGRVRPALDGVGGRGLWLANQLCDLVQVRSSPAGTVVRLRMAVR